MNVRVLISPALLTIVAIVQMAAATWGPLSPWKGGGFGMFASEDRPDTRLLSVVALGRDAVPYRVQVPFDRNQGSGPFASSFDLLTRTFPTHARLMQLADAVSQADLVIDAQPKADLRRRLEFSDHADILTNPRLIDRELRVVGLMSRPGSFHPVSVRVAVLRLRLDPGGVTASLEELAAVSVKTSLR